MTVTVGLRKFVVLPALTGLEEMLFPPVTAVERLPELPAAIVLPLASCCLSRNVVVVLRTAVVLPADELLTAEGAVLVLPDVLVSETVVRL